MNAPVRSPLHPAVVLASNVPFAIIFGIFVVALVVLIVIVLRWAIRRDRAGRSEWRQRQRQRQRQQQRQQERSAAGEGDLPSAPRR